ncbi:NUDIX hydrolase [Paenisporosarcina indica]|uniref:NUDIX hydrolase n=1 Tax=Paenisporosarcina indica TaxID=650093 RepID=UPI00095014EE|nr:NUDIX hydrolase [Paenisporosarcina indica]
MKKWKMIKSEYLFKTPFGNLRKDRCELPNGIVIDDYYVNEYSDWVNAIVITTENQIVLVEQYRYSGDDFFLEIPAGKIEENETQEEGILREIKEETGFTSLSKPILLGEFMVNPATQNNKVKSYLILDAFQAYEQDLDETEEITIKLVDFYAMGDLIKSNQIKTQLFTVSAYYMAKDLLNEKLSNARIT